MKFTEGYWLQSERAHSQYAAEAYYVDPIPGGMRVAAHLRPCTDRGATLNIGTITIEFIARAEDVISVHAWHYEGYDTHAPQFEKN